MKKILFALVIIIVPLLFCGFADPNNISAQSAILYAPETGEVIFAHNADQVLSMASTTKIMTCLLGLEYIEKNGDTVIDVTDKMVMVEGSSMGLRGGDKINLYDVCLGMMLCSGNDAANTIAEFISPNGGFIKLMNEKAQEIGMTSTSFATPSGLDDEMHYSTAKDMAVLTAYAMKNQGFKDIVSSKKATISYNNGESVTYLSNHNKLLSLMEDCIGVKTGFTKKSGRCLVSAAQRDGVTLIAVTLNAPDDWNDHMNLYDYGFQQFSQYQGVNNSFKVYTSEGNLAKLRVEEPVTINYYQGEITERVYLPKFIYLDSTEVYGRIDYLLNGELILSKNIVL